MLTITEPRGAEDLDAVRALCWDYRDFLKGLGGQDAEIVTYAYPPEKYAALMDNLETTHAPPSGGIRLARLDGAAVGCGMFHTLSPGTAEIKRVYVAPHARGTGAGRAIMTTLIDACRHQGFQRILMDTGQPLKAAQQLYLSLGFQLRGAYWDVPDFARGRLVFFEMALT
ncbi:MAG: GNAT family N-acetyltransferase [Marinibacterium sp.]